MIYPTHKLTQGCQNWYDRDNQRFKKQNYEENELWGLRMQLHELFVQPPSEHAISTIEKRATALNNKVTLPKQE